MSELNAEKAVPPNLRDAVVEVLRVHRTPVYGSCSCGWSVPGYPHTTGAVLWRQHVADEVVRLTFWDSEAHEFVLRSERGYDCACGWSGLYSREVGFDTAPAQHREHLASLAVPPGSRGDA